MNSQDKLIIVDFFRQLLDLYEFELYINANLKIENVFKLNDKQGANWSYIEQDEFSSLADIMERLDSPHHDYIYRALEEREDAKEDILITDWDLTAKRYIESDKVAEILSEIHPKEYLELDLPNGYMESKIMFELLNEFEFPLIKKYAISDEKSSDFFSHFSLVQLQNFEQSLQYYFIEKSIVYNNDGFLEFKEKENYSFNTDILRLACGLETYEDFIENYTNHPLTNYNKIFQKVAYYFKENDIENLMEYGSDSDEGLYHLSSMYSEIMDELEIKYKNIYTEDGISDGKYLTTIVFEDGSRIELDTSAWNDIETVIDNVSSILEEYEKLKSKDFENKNNEEIDYDLI